VHNCELPGHFRELYVMSAYNRSDNSKECAIQFPLDLVHQRSLPTLSRVKTAEVLFNSLLVVFKRSYPRNNAFCSELRCFILQVECRNQGGRGRRGAVQFNFHVSKQCNVWTRCEGICLTNKLFKSNWWLPGECITWIQTHLSE